MLRILEYPNGQRKIQMLEEYWATEEMKIIPGFGGGPMPQSIKLKRWADVPVIKMDEPQGNL